MALPLPRELGEILTATIPNPAPGANFAHAIPNGETWRLLTCDLVLTVALGTKAINIAVEDPVNQRVWGTSEPTAFPLGATTISWGIGIIDSAAVVNARFAKQLPSCYFNGPATLVSVANLGPADTYTFIRIMYQRWRSV